MTVATTVKKTPNKKQQDCIDNINGKYLVLAGPGTGKTFTIIERIKNMLSKGISQDKILCLTFTDAAATEMKKRIEAELDVISCDVQIFTYHGFCCNIIDEYLEEFEVPANYKIISDPVAKAFIKECIDELNPTYYRTEKNDPYYYINIIKRQISAIKQNRLTKEKFFENLEDNLDWKPAIRNAEEKIEMVLSGKDKRCKKPPYDVLDKAVKKVAQAEELWKFYELYQQKMDSAGYLDFNDMINLVLDKFEKEPSFLHQIANRYEYLMVDEYQDTNKSQNEIVFALTQSLDSENVLVVGDDDQIIYRFQGAKLDTIENFLRKFPDTKIICLTENMRSTQPILDAARAVIQQDPLSLVNTCNFKDKDGNDIDKNLVAKNEEVISKTKPVRFYTYADIDQEYAEIVREIEELTNSDECPKDKSGEKLYSQIAILTRSNAELEGFAQMLKSRNIPYELKDGKDIFSIPAVNVLYFYIQFLINPHMHSWRIFQLLTAQPFCINPQDYQILFDEVSKKETFIDVLRTADWKSFKDAEKLQNFLKTYDYLTEYKSKENIKNTILEIGAKTGIFDYYFNTEVNQTESIAGLKKFLEEAEGFSSIYKTSFLEEFYTYLQSIVEDDETINTEKSPVPMNAVQLCTYHGSKGREFEYVYMPTLERYKWESSSKSLKPEIPLERSEYKTDNELKEEVKPSDLAKLMYVAMTRAKHTLRMSCPETINKKPKKPTKFIVEIQDLLEKEPVPFTYTEESYWKQQATFLIKKDYDYKKDFHELITAKLADRAFSASSVNRYLACPRMYLYNDILKLSPKDGNPNALSYGSAIHKACEEAFKYLKEHQTPPTKEQVVKWFKDKFATLRMESYEQRKHFEGRGENALDKFYSQIVNTPSAILVEQEKEISVTLDDGTKFYGIIDRIDKNDDGTYSIYDYKTGNNKNSGIKIEGVHEDYYNQMAWYKYFYELATGHKVSLTKFIYPEDFLSKNEGITYTQEEIDTAVETFRNAVKRIKSHEFEPSYKESSCRYCAYKDFCGMNRL